MKRAKVYIGALMDGGEHVKSRNARERACVCSLSFNPLQIDYEARARERVNHLFTSRAFLGGYFFYEGYSRCKILTNDANDSSNYLLGAGIALRASEAFGFENYIEIKTHSNGLRRFSSYIRLFLDNVFKSVRTIENHGFIFGNHRLSYTLFSKKKKKKRSIHTRLPSEKP